MAELGARDRAKLPDSAFAYVDSTGRRLLPIHDEAHVRNALARFNRVVFEDEEARDRARSKLLKAAKRYGIMPVGFIDGQLRPRLPTGTVTLLFADLVDSTRHLADLGDRYAPMLNAVRRIIRTAVRRAGGTEVDARADEFFAAFTDAAAALRAATAAQRGIREARWPAGHEARLRIGLHTGRPTATATGYVGIAVNTVARICAVADGGQILVSPSTRAVLIDAGAGVQLASIGPQPLRGIAGAIELFAVTEPTGTAP